MIETIVFIPYAEYHFTEFRQNCPPNWISINSFASHMGNKQYVKKYNNSLEKYGQTRLIRTLLIRHLRLIRLGNLKTLKPLPLIPMLNQLLN